MRTLQKLLFVAIFIAAVMALPLNVLAQGSEQTDHMQLPSTEVGYCGLGTNAEPWTLSIAASGVAVLPGAGKLNVEFRDGTSITFNIGTNNSISLTQQMGGVPGVDDLVRITLSGSGAVGAEAWVSARARPNAKDPFIEPGAPEDDNLCVNLNDEGPINTFLAVPDAWVTDGFGGNGGTLQ